MSSEGTVVEWGGQPWVVSNHMIRVLGYDGDTYALLLVGLDGSFDWVDKRRVDELPRMSIIGPVEGWHHTAKPERETWHAPGYNTQTLREVVAWCSERGVTLSRWCGGKHQGAGVVIHWAIHHGPRATHYGKQDGIIACVQSGTTESNSLKRADTMLRVLLSEAEKKMGGQC